MTSSYLFKFIGKAKFLLHIYQVKIHRIHDKKQFNKGHVRSTFQDLNVPITDLIIMIYSI